MKHSVYYTMCFFKLLSCWKVLILQLHDYISAPSRIRHQSSQSNTELKDSSTQTDFSCLPPQTRTYETQTSSPQTKDKCCQVSLPTLTFENVRTSDSKVLFYTGIPKASTFKAMFDELEPGVAYKRERPRSLRPIDDLFMVLMRLRLGLLLEDLADRF